MKKLPVDETGLLSLLNRWRAEAEKESGRPIRRICVAYEAGRDGFWLARWLRDRGIEAHVMHATSIPVKRDHRRARTDRLDCLLLMRAFLGWLRGEEDHCRMVAVPTIEEEDARRTHRERKRLVGEQTKLINKLKSVFACLGIRGFNPKLKKACERLEALRTPEGGPIPQGTLAELKRAMARLALVRDQIREIDKHRQERIGQDKTAQEQRPSDAGAMLLPETRAVRAAMRSALPAGVPALISASACRTAARRSRAASRAASGAVAQASDGSGMAEVWGSVGVSEPAEAKAVSGVSGSVS